MNKSDLFSYLSAFVTIVLAVALGDMIQSTHRLIRARRRVKWDVIPLIFAGIVAVIIVSEFFSLWELVAVKEVSLLQLIWLLTIPILVALLAYSALPDEVPDAGLDLTRFYNDERRVWVVIFGVATLLDTVRNLVRIGGNEQRAAGMLTYLAPLLAITAIGLAMMWVGRNRHWNAAGVVVVAAITLYATSGWTISAKT